MGGPDDAREGTSEDEVRHALADLGRPMNESTLTPLPIPSRPASQWPIGMRLRFRTDAQLDPRHDSLRNKPVLVLSGMKLLGPSHGSYSWRQEVLSLSTGRIGWARPDQLALPLDGADPESF